MSQQSAWGPYDPTPHLHNSSRDRRGGPQYSRPSNSYNSHTPQHHQEQHYRGNSHPPARRAYSQHDDRGYSQHDDRGYSDRGGYSGGDRGFGDRAYPSDRGYGDRGYGGEDRGYDSRHVYRSSSERGGRGYNARARGSSYPSNGGGRQRGEGVREEREEEGYDGEEYWADKSRRVDNNAGEYGMMPPAAGGYGPPPPGFLAAAAYPPGMPAHMPYGAPPPHTRAEGGSGKPQTSPISYTREHPLKKCAESPKSPDFVPAFMEPQFSPPVSSSKPSSAGGSEQSEGQRAQKYEPPQRRWARQRVTSGSSAGGDQEHMADYRDYLAKEVVKTSSWDGPDEWNVKGPNPAHASPWEEESSKKQGYDKAAQEWKENMRIDEPIVLKADSGRQKAMPAPSSQQWNNNKPRGRSSPPPRFRHQHSEGDVEEYEGGGSPRGYYGGGGYRGGGGGGGFRDSTASSNWEREYRGGGGYPPRSGTSSKDWRSGGDGGAGRRERKPSVESPPVRSASSYSDSPPSFSRHASNDEVPRPTEHEYEKRASESRDYYEENRSRSHSDRERQSSTSSVKSSSAKDTEVRKVEEDNKATVNSEHDATKEITENLRSRRPDLLVYIPKGRRPPEKPTPKISVCEDPFAPEPKPPTPPPPAQAPAQPAAPQPSKAAGKKKKKKEKGKAENNNKQQQQQQQQQQNKKQQKQDKKKPSPTTAPTVNNNNTEGVPDTWEEEDEEGKEKKKEGKESSPPQDNGVTPQLAAAAALAKLEERPKKRKGKYARDRKKGSQVQKSAAEDIKDVFGGNDPQEEAPADVEKPENTVDAKPEETKAEEVEKVDIPQSWEEEQEEEEMDVTEDEPEVKEEKVEKKEEEELLDDIMDLIADKEDSDEAPPEEEPAKSEDDATDQMEGAEHINGENEEMSEEADEEEVESKEEAIDVKSDVSNDVTSDVNADVTDDVNEVLEDPLLNDKQEQLAKCAEEEAEAAAAKEQEQAPVQNLTAVAKPKKRKLKAKLGKGGNSNEINKAIVNDLFSESKEKGDEKKEEEEEEKQTEGKAERGGGDEEEESWDAMFDDNGDCLDPTIVEELTTAVGNVKVEKTQFDYYNFRPEEPDMDYTEYSHLIEIFDFPGELQTRDLLMAFKEFKDKGFDIKWVDDTHAVGVFSSSIAARSALALTHPLIKVRPISQASRQTKNKARKTSEFLQPYKPRPETSAQVARNMVAGALGLRNTIPKEKRDEERRKLAAAKEKKKMEKMLSKDAWEGIVGSCAMDNV